MRGFLSRDIRAAIGHALAGHQALHLHTVGVGAGAPGVFKNAVAGGQWIAHLFDQDTDRLVKTAKRLGVRKIVVDRPGEPAQHVDLCGLPLSRALAECDNRADLPTQPGDSLPAPAFVAEHQQERPAPPPDQSPPAAIPEDEMRFGNLPSLFVPPRRQGP